jgi:micrococcal nuclease
LKKLLVVLLVVFTAVIFGAVDVNLTMFDYDTGIVTRVVDGDTLKVLINEKEYTVRLLAVDTPETVAPGKPVEEGGPEASAFTKKKMTGRMIYLTYDEDKTDFFGRLLAYVWYIEEKDSVLRMVCFNKELIEAGHSELYTKYPFELRWFFEEN